MKLYEYANEFLRLQQEVEANDGELPPDIEGALTACQLGVEEKARNIAWYLRQLKGEEETLRKLAQEFTKKAQMKDNAAKRMGEYLLREMEKMGFESIPAGEFTVKIRLNPESVEFDGDLETLPPSFITLKKELNKAGVKDAYMLKANLHGCKVERKKRLEIKAR